MSAIPAGLCDFGSTRPPSASCWLAIVLLLLPACATPAISPAVMQQVDKNLTYGILAADPDAHQGQTALLGGTIVKTTPKPGETEIEVIQKELTADGEPVISDKSAGRFLVVVDRFLDPDIYKPDRRLTVAGEVKGAVVRQLGETDYRYPVLVAKDLHLWAIRSPRPVSIIWGVGGGYPYGYPYWGWGLYPETFFWP